MYRFLKKKELLLLNQEEEILIYEQPLPKPLTGGTTNVTNYYFSVGKEGEVQMLTIKNLKIAFYDNKKFLALVDKNFKYNLDLATFDKNSKTYEINWLLRQTEK